MVRRPAGWAETKDRACQPSSCFCVILRTRHIRPAARADFSWSACLPNRQAELIPLQRLLLLRWQIGSFTCVVRGVMRTAVRAPSVPAAPGWAHHALPASSNFEITSLLLCVL